MGLGGRISVASHVASLAFCRVLVAARVIVLSLHVATMLVVIHDF